MKAKTQGNFAKGKGQSLGERQHRFGIPFIFELLEVLVFIGKFKKKTSKSGKSKFAKKGKQKNRKSSRYLDQINVAKYVPMCGGFTGAPGHHMAPWSGAAFSDWADQWARKRSDDTLMSFVVTGGRQGRGSGGEAPPP